MAALPTSGVPIYKFPDEQTIQTTILNHNSFKVQDTWPKREIVEAITLLAAKCFAGKTLDSDGFEAGISRIVYEIKKGEALQKGIDRDLSIKIFRANLPVQYLMVLPFALKQALIQYAKIIE